MSIQTFNSQILPLKDKLYRFSYRILKNSQEAEDVVQEIMIKVWNKRDEWESWSSIEAMCMTMTRNMSIDRTRSKHKRVGQLPDHFDAPATTATPEQTATSNDMMSHIQQLINQLPDVQRSIIQLRDVEGYSYKEIAEMMDISMSQVKIGIHRARLFLKKELVKSTEYGRSQNR